MGEINFFRQKHKHESSAIINSICLATDIYGVINGSNIISAVKHTFPQPDNANTTRRKKRILAEIGADGNKYFLNKIFQR
jgi:hypothetical protein